MKKLFLSLLAVMMAVICALAQGRTVKGTVFSASDGEPLIGVSVHALGTNVGVTTDFDGNFVLNVPNNASKLKNGSVEKEKEFINAANIFALVAIEKYKDSGKLRHECQELAKISKEQRGEIEENRKIRRFIIAAILFICFAMLSKTSVLALSIIASIFGNTSSVTFP